jgi:hypothetical protein
MQCLYNTSDKYRYRKNTYKDEHKRECALLPLQKSSRIIWKKLSLDSKKHEPAPGISFDAMRRTMYCCGEKPKGVLTPYT